MLKLRRAVFCYYILRFDRGFHSWLLLITESLRVAGLLSIDDSWRKQTAKWLTDMFEKPVDFDTVVEILVGDSFAQNNKQDIAKIQQQTGKKITELWDTDPIFSKYPHLRGLARNREHEAVWAKIKSDAKQKQK